MRRRSRTPSPPPEEQPTILIPVPAPPPPTDLTPSALLVPLGAISSSHIGRKLRLRVQILAIDPAGKHALVSSLAQGTRPTLMVSLSTALLGHSPASTVVRPPERWASAGEVRPDPGVAREKLYLGFGEWINVVGWLEAAETLPKVAIPTGCAHPPLVLLEAIHVSPARAPTQDGLFRGQLN
ncbi:uncharacterized protein LOC62_03G003745 [Vanrija pseudolonga]|uniref:Uncharacterized protein n=1 Tax=Vanrija pseudolonga TaxID=143232 RepID=A0AAF1BJT5_9TREE|nr:hypothetical protein LOC62_03G003745 [Vanrija pseudolonga]